MISSWKQALMHELVSLLGDGTLVAVAFKVMVHEVGNAAKQLARTYRETRTAVQTITGKKTDRAANAANATDGKAPKATKPKRKS